MDFIINCITVSSQEFKQSIRIKKEEENATTCSSPFFDKSVWLRTVTNDLILLLSFQGTDQEQPWHTPEEKSVPFEDTSYR